MIEMIVAFCIVLVEEPRHKGGKSICNWWAPKVEFKTKQECKADKKMIEDYLIEEAWRIHPKAVRITASGLCMDEK